MSYNYNMSLNPTAPVYNTPPEPAPAPASFITNATPMPMCHMGMQSGPMGPMGHMGHMGMPMGMPMGQSTMSIGQINLNTLSDHELLLYIDETFNHYLNDSLKINIDIIPINTIISIKNELWRRNGYKQSYNIKLDILNLPNNKTYFDFTKNHITFILKNKIGLPISNTPIHIMSKTKHLPYHIGSDMKLHYTILPVTWNGLTNIIREYILSLQLVNVSLSDKIHVYSDGIMTSESTGMKRKRKSTKRTRKSTKRKRKSTKRKRKSTKRTRKSTKRKS